MKLRIRNNTVRFRLARNEVTALRDGTTVSQVTRFSIAHQLGCEIVPAAGEGPTIEFDAGTIRMTLPTRLVREWADTDQVGFRFEQWIDGTTALAVLVEKDFVCLHGEQDTPDAYPNPEADRREPAACG